MEFVLHQRLYREQDAAIHIIQQIKRRKNDQRGAGLELLVGHKS
jgi:hypothetical protein